MKHKMCVRLAAFVSVLLLLVASITPVLAQTTMEWIVLSVMRADNSSEIKGFGTFVVRQPRAEGRFIIQVPPDPIHPRAMYVLAPEEGRIECIGEALHIWIQGTAYQRGDGPVLSSEFTLTVMPSSASRTGDSFFDWWLDMTSPEGETSEIHIDNVHMRLTPSNPCQR